MNTQLECKNLVICKFKFASLGVFCRIKGIERNLFKLFIQVIQFIQVIFSVIIKFW